LNGDDLEGVDTPLFTLGPSLSSFDCRFISNNTFHITAAHSFQINKSILKMRSDCYDSGKSFEYCSAYGAVGTLVHIPTDSVGKITHDLALVSISPRIRSSTDLLIGHKLPRSNKHFDSNKLNLNVSGYLTYQKLLEKKPLLTTVYKNGGTTGLTEGLFVTIGREWIADRSDEINKERIDKYYQKYSSDREYFVVKAKKGNFSEDGDSGSSVWLAKMKEQSTNDAESATIVGILTGGIIGLNSFSVVALLDEEVISKFVEEAIKLNK
jgi:hypothetical protein